MKQITELAQDFSDKHGSNIISEPESSNDFDEIVREMMVTWKEADDENDVEEMLKAWVGMEENSYCMEQAQMEAENSIDLDLLCGIEPSHVDEEEDEHEGDINEMNVDETGLEQPSENQVNEWEIRLKEVASDMLVSEGYDHLGSELESFVGKLKRAQHRIAAEAMAKKQERSFQSNLHSFFQGPKKQQQQAGEQFEL